MDTMSWSHYFLWVSVHAVNVSTSTSGLFFFPHSESLISGVVLNMDDETMLLFQNNVIVNHTGCLWDWDWDQDRH